MSRRKARLLISGTLKETLPDLVKGLVEKGAHIVVGNANKAALSIIAAYPRVTGNLKAGVEVDVETSPLATKATVVNRAKHAFIYENGTEARHYITSHGEKKETGRMPPGHVFDPIVRRYQRKTDEELAKLMAEAGLTVRKRVA